MFYVMVEVEFVKITKSLYNTAVLLSIVLLLVLNCLSFANGANADFEKTLDDFMKKALDESKVAGATVTVVKDGRVLLSKGYGYSDVESNKKVDPVTDQFLIGSVTKLFTATAVLQLVEKGAVDLDEDINKYLTSYKVEHHYPNKLTLRHLLTNTGGFEESVTGIYHNALYNALIPLDKTIKETMPKLVRNPGEVIQYSNHGFALAGYVVENVSGMEFNKYVEQNIFKPLAMTNTSYFLSTTNKDVVSKGYAYENSDFSEQQMGTVAVHPAGSVTASASDMGKFLLAHINDGEFNGNMILNKETAQSMKTLQYTQNSEMSGYGLGFYQNAKNNEIFMHDGEVDAFTSQLSVYPSGGIGYFISYNTLDDGALRDKFEDFFYGYYNVSLKRKDYSAETFVKNQENLKGFTGEYVLAQRITDGVLKIRGLFLKMNVKFDDNNNLVLRTFDSNMSGTYEYYKDNLFIKRQDNRKVFLKAGEGGQKYIFIDEKVPMQTLQKLNVNDIIFENYVRNYVFLIPFFSALLWIGNLFRRNKKKREGHAKHVKMATSCISLLIFIVLIALMVIMFTQSDQFRSAIVIAVNVIAVVMVALSATLVWKVIAASKEKMISIWRMCYSLLVLIAGIGAIVYVSYLDILFI